MAIKYKNLGRLLQIFYIEFILFFIKFNIYFFAAGAPEYPPLSYFGFIHFKLSQETRIKILVTTIIGIKPEQIRNF